jgi:hypothetical protein
LSEGLDADLATEHCNKNGEKQPHEITGNALYKNERNIEEREMLKLTAREKS